MGWGVKIDGSRGSKWRLDPILGPFLAILAIFGPFWLFGWGATAPSGSGPTLVGVKWGGESKLVGPEGPSGVQTLIFGHFEPFWALLGLF